MAKNNQRNGKLVHTRKIEINTFDLGDHQVLVEGNLRDARPSHSPSGEPEGSPRLIHNLIARLWIKGPDLTISAVEAEMPTIPREMCTQALPGIQKLSGVKVITGFTQQVKDLIGDVKGCSHLTSLFLTLGPAAVQGYFAAYGRKPQGRSLHNPALSRVIDSCHVWRKDGPFVKSLIAASQRDQKGT